MIQQFLSICLVVFFSSTGFAFDHQHRLWSDVLREFRDLEGFVYYSKLKNEGQKPEHAFPKYLQEIQRVTHQEYLKWDQKQKMAYLINAYNAFTVKLIVDHYPIASITDIGGWLWWATKKPWKMEFS